MGRVEAGFWTDVSYRLQCFAMQSFFKLFAALSVDSASGLGGRLARIVGPRISSHKRALKNLRTVFPEKSESEICLIAAGMWENTGRLMAEYSHLETILADPKRVKITGLDECAANMAGRKSGFVLTGHYGNWEITTLAGRKLGMRQVTLYRAANNPYVDEFFAARRRKTVNGGLLAKADGNIRSIMRLLGQGYNIGMLVDQREDRGLQVQFLGRPSNTLHAPSLLARRGDHPIFIGRARRTGGANFELECQPVPVDVTEDWETDVKTTTQKINDIMTSWIIETPEQWLWTHRRW